VIAITTGRQTSQRLNTLLKELAYTIPNSKIVRRGKSSIDQLTVRLVEDGFSRLIMLCRWHGGPGRIDFYNVNPNGLTRLPPSIVLKQVRLRREYPRGGRHLAQAIACESEVSAQTQRFAASLSRILGLPVGNLKELSHDKAVIQIASAADGSLQIAVTSSPSGNEVGPRLIVSQPTWNANESQNES
jgi:rRNA maturation protein Rpf1